jgi:hypothetical protein
LGLYNFWLVIHHKRTVSLLRPINTGVDSHG